MIRGPPGHLRHNTGKAQRFQVEFVNEDIDDADRIVLRHVVVQAGGKRCRCWRSSPSTKRFIPTPADRESLYQISAFPHSLDPDRTSCPWSSAPFLLTSRE